jgi:hypothetical protein
VSTIISKITRVPHFCFVSANYNEPVGSIVTYFQTKIKDIRIPSICPLKKYRCSDILDFAANTRDLDIDVVKFARVLGCKTKDLLQI